MKFLRFISSMICLELSTITALFFVMLLLKVPGFGVSLFVLGMVMLSLIAALGFVVDIISLYRDEL